MSINRGIHKGDVVHKYNGILLSHKKEQNSAICRDMDGLRDYYWRRQWQPSLVHLPGKSHGWRKVVGYSPRGHKESDMTERLHFHFLSYRVK